MPLPTSDAIAFRGIPSLGDKATIALSLTLTNKQVEELFARHEAINKLTSGSAGEFPLEIDFDKKKLHIGNTTTQFNSAKETGIREVCRRTPSTAKPLAGLFKSAAVVGKLTIPRELDDVASGLRKAAKTEQAKRNKRGIVRTDAPFPAPKPKGKRSQPSGAVSLIKKAAANRAASSRADFTTPVSTNSSKPSSSRSFPPSTIPPITSDPTGDPNVNSLRSRLTHFIAASARPKEVAISQFINASRDRGDVNEAEVRKLFEEVAQEIPGPRNSDPNHWIWDLKSSAWLEVKQSNDTPDQAARRTRIGLLGMSFRRHSVASTSKRRLEDDDEDISPPKPPPVIAAETRLEPEVRSWLTPTSSTFSSMPKPSKKAPSRKEPSPKYPVPANNSTQKRRLSDLESEPSSELEEGEIPTKEYHKRRIIGPPKATKLKACNVGNEERSVVRKGAKSSFSSDKEQDETETHNSVSAIPTGRLSLTNTTNLAPRTNVSKEGEFDSATLPEDKESLRREYDVQYANYLNILSKCYAQKAKVEAALALDDDASVDVEDSDLMDSEELMELFKEFDGLRNELERIRKAHRNLNVSAS